MTAYVNLDAVVAQLRSAGLMLETVKKPNGGSQIGPVYVESIKSVRIDLPAIAGKAAREHFPAHFDAAYRQALATAR